MAAGKVIIGFSYPTVGMYNHQNGAVTYTGGMRLARGVKVAVSVETSEDNEFYADNRLAEVDSGEFVKGTATLTVDGLKEAAEKLIFGLPEPEEVTYGENLKVKVTKYGKKAKPPYVGIGFIVMYQSEGVITHQPIILTKGKFSTASLDAETKQKEKDYQTQDLEAKLARDDTNEENWKWVAEEQTSEEAALAILDTLLGVKAVAG